MLTAVLMASFGLLLVPSSASAADPPMPPGSVGSDTCGWGSGWVHASTGVCDTNEQAHSFSWAGAPQPLTWLEWYQPIGALVMSGTCGDFNMCGTYKDLGNGQTVSREYRLFSGPVGAHVLMGSMFIGPKGEVFPNPYGEPIIPSIKASVCKVGSGFSAAKGSWSANGLSVFFRWAGLPPAHGWYWYGAQPGKVILATGNLSGAIGRVQLPAWPGNYGLDKASQPAPMVKAIRVYSVDDMACYVDIAIPGGTVDAPATDPTKKEQTTGVGSDPGDVVPPGGTDATPDPVSGAFDECGNVLSDMWCYISKLPGWLFVPSQSTTDGLTSFGTDMMGKAPLGWIGLAQGLSDAAAGAGDPKAGGAEDTQGGLGVIYYDRLAGCGDRDYIHGYGCGYTPFLPSSGVGSGLLTAFRPILTVVLLVGLYAGVGIFIGKVALRKAMT